VDGARHQLFTGSRFAVDVHRGVGRRHLGNGLKDRLHGGGLPDDVFEDIATGGVGAQGSGVRLGPLAGSPLGSDLQRPLDLEAHHLSRERLLQKIEGAEAHGLHGGLHGAERRDDHRRTLRVRFAHLGQHLEAAAALHLEIRDDEVDAPTSKGRQPCRRGAGRQDFVPHAAHDGRSPRGADVCKVMPTKMPWGSPRISCPTEPIRRSPFW